MTTTRESRPLPAHLLPERPHLDHLRHEARRRHATLKAVSHSARLADAQFLVARDYGYANWMALKVEVERRRQLCGTVDTGLPVWTPRLPVPTRRRDRIAALAHSDTAEQALFPTLAVGLLVVQFAAPIAALAKALLG